MLIDVHAHALPRDFFTMMGLSEDDAGEIVFPGYGAVDKLLYDLNGRLENLKARGVDLQIVSPPPNLQADIDMAPNVEFSRMLNGYMAKLIEEGGGLLAGLAVAPLGDPDHAVEELQRAIGEYGFVGLALPTSVMGKPLDDPAFSALFAYLEAEDLPAFIHPTNGVRRDTLESYTMNTLVGWPHETALAVARLIFSGICERHPNLKLVLAHGGGTISWLMGRIDRGYTAPKYEANPECSRYISRPPSDYLREFFFDTCTLSPESLLCLIDIMGADHVVFGSDLPFEIGDAEGKTASMALEKLSEPDKKKILGSNAAAVFNLT
jgi:aminocarboxymuconate-semialdehyde decarboxylase